MRTILPDAFPPLLQEITDPPEKLFVRGALPSFDLKYLCVVGSRKCSPYAENVIHRLISGLRGYPIVIVSGLALGVDALAHTQALEAGLTTIAVPGSGLDPSVIYPATNARLAEKIVAEGGALISEFEPDFRATTWSFPQRNRIMAGLSHATLVIEAMMRSGTLITARLAGEYNRDVLAVPGSILSPSSTGTHYLLKNGAGLIETPEDILDALGLRHAGSGQEALPLDLSKEEKQVLEAIASGITKEELLETLDLPAHTLQILLSSLELRGLIREKAGKIVRA